jgi:hypothetical protein
MNVKGLVENAAASIVSSSLAANNIADWNIYTGMGTGSIGFPCVKIICDTYSPYYPELNIGIGRARLKIITCANKVMGTNAGEGTSSTEFEAVSDYAINPFLKDNVAVTFGGYENNLIVKQVIEDGLTISTLDDGWVANQSFQVVCGRTS